MSASQVYRAPDGGASSGPTRATTVSITQLLAGYGGIVALDVASLSLRAGTVYGLVGSNGAGKSTLLRTLAGLQRPIRGAGRLHEKLKEVRGVGFRS